eukprot:m.267193 g.267193  ORF g.267193 m.267193 type:complete len:107 (-) comp15634_c5_seq14:3001-3321(-)
MHSARVPLAQHAYTSAAPDTHDTHMSSLSDCCGKAPVQSTYAPGTRVTTVYPYESARPDEVDFEEHQTIIVLNPEQHVSALANMRIHIAIDVASVCLRVCLYMTTT